MHWVPVFYAFSYFILAMISRGIVRFSQKGRAVVVRVPEGKRLRTVHEKKMAVGQKNRVAVTAQLLALRGLFQAFPEIELSTRKTLLATVNRSAKGMADAGIGRIALSKFVVAGLTPFLSEDQIGFYSGLHRAIQSDLLKRMNA